MGFGQFHSAILNMIDTVLLDDPLPQEAARKAGFRVGGTGGGEGVGILTCALSDGAGLPVGDETGFSFDVMPASIQNYFVWEPLQEVFEWWPDGYEYGFHTTQTDLSSCSEVKNSWVVVPGSANPDLNIRVMMSLDGVTWAYPTVPIAGDDAWRFEGANVNCGQWLTYTEADVPYQDYPPYYASREGVDNAFPGGWTTSGWRTLLPAYQVENVFVRWTADWSHSYSDDPFYTSFKFLSVGYGEIRAR